MKRYLLTVREALRCACRSPWCALDAVFLCKWRRACDRHDAYIIGERAP